jgi:hypothetical protein
MRPLGWFSVPFHATFSCVIYFGDRYNVSWVMYIGYGDSKLRPFYGNFYISVAAIIWVIDSYPHVSKWSECVLVLYTYILII